VGEVDEAIRELGAAHTALEAYAEAIEAIQGWALDLPQRMTHDGERWGTEGLNRAMKRMADKAGELDDGAKLAQALAAAKREAENAAGRAS